MSAITAMSVQEWLNGALFLAIIAVIGERVKRLRTKDEKNSAAFEEMRIIADEYKAAWHAQKVDADEAIAAGARFRRELEQATLEVSRLSIKVMSLESALDDAQNAMGRLLELVKTSTS